MARVAQQAHGRVGFELVEHVGHRHQQPAHLGRHGRVVHRGADQEHHEVTFELGGPPSWLNNHDRERPIGAEWLSIDPTGSDRVCARPRVS